MALRDQPYIPVYVDKFTNDEKLRECSASANGVMIRVMLYMHKAKTSIYGRLPLKMDFAYNFAIANGLANDIASARILLTNLLPTCLDFASMFASMFAKQFPYTFDETKSGLVELCDNEVIFYENFCLCQRGMIKQGQISDKRAKSGSNGGKKREENLKNEKKFANSFAIANDEANSLANDEANSIIIIKSKNRVDNKGVSNNTGGVQGIENSGGEEGEGEINHYGTNWHLFTTVQHCKEIYFSHANFDIARADALRILYTSAKIDDQELLLERLELWATEFNKFLMRTTQQKQMSGTDGWPNHFHNWLAKQGIRLKTKPDGRIKEIENQSIEGKKNGIIPSLENGFTQEQIDEHYTYKPKHSRK